MGNASKVLKGFHMAIEEAFLPLGGKYHRERSARKAQPHDKQLHFLAHAPDDGVGFAPIYLRILTRIIFQWEKHVRRARGLLVATNILTDGRFASLVALGGNDLKDPMCRVALLAGEPFVFLQKLPNTFFVGTKNRFGLLTWRWA